MKLATWMGLLFLGGTIAAPAVAHAGASQIWYQQKKAEVAATVNQAQPAIEHTVLDVAKREGMFGTFLSALEAAGLSDMLRQPGPYTVFAPTDEAFAAIPAGELQALMRDKARLKQVLGYHIVPQKKYDWDMRRDVLRTLDGGTLTVNQYTSPEDIRINTQAEVLETNIRASNGVLHAIDRVMIPQG
jgi:uncharacterized surface protein with fasciclin (FAS1) repeats